MGRANIDGVYLMLQQGKTSKKLRILLEVAGVRNTLGLLVDRLLIKGSSGFFITSARGTEVSARTLHLWWDTARQKAISKAIGDDRQDLAEKTAKFQFRDIRPKAASEIIDIGDASRLLGHSKEGITERVYRRIGAIASPTK
jgi:integrase